MFGCKQTSAPVQALHKANSHVANIFGPSASDDHHNAGHSFSELDKFMAQLDDFTQPGLKEDATTKAESRRLFDHVADQSGSHMLLEPNPQPPNNEAAQLLSPPTIASPSGSLILSSMASGSLCGPSTAISASSKSHFEIPFLFSPLGALSRPSSSIGNVIDTVACD